jgi:hypothetical protein
MNALRIASLVVALSLVSAAAAAQTNVRVRGTVTGFDGKLLEVKSRDGKDLKLQAEKATVAAAKAITLADLKSGDYVGVTAMPGADGRLVASEVHTIARTVPEGHTPWDMGPGTTMTNANIEKMVKAAKGNELTLQYKGGTQTILVPDGTPIVTNVPADSSLLKPGVYVFIAAQSAADGTLTALRIQAEKDGVKPPQ